MGSMDLDVEVPCVQKRRADAAVGGAGGVLSVHMTCHERAIVLAHHRQSTSTENSTPHPHLSRMYIHTRSCMYPASSHLIREVEPLQELGRARPPALLGGAVDEGRLRLLHVHHGADALQVRVRALEDDLCMSLSCRVIGWGGQGSIM